MHIRNKIPMTEDSSSLNELPSPAPPKSDQQLGLEKLIGFVPKDICYRQQ
jgi:hypothetical protein